MYAGNNPVNLKDPGGQDPLGAVVGAVVGGYYGFIGAEVGHGSTGEVIASTLAGAGIGALVGFVDPTEGYITANTLGAVTGDLVGQLISQVPKGGFSPNYGELIGAGIGGVASSYFGLAAAALAPGLTSNALGAAAVGIFGNTPGFLTTLTGGAIGQSSCK